MACYFFEWWCSRFESSKRFDTLLTTCIGSLMRCKGKQACDLPSTAPRWWSEALHSKKARNPGHK